jgi:hypothetical protein
MLGCFGDGGHAGKRGQKAGPGRQPGLKPPAARRMWAFKRHADPRSLALVKTHAMSGAGGNLGAAICNVAQRDKAWFAPLRSIDNQASFAGTARV